MTGQQPIGDRGRVRATGTAAPASPSAPPTGPHVGPVRITPVRLTLALAFGGGLAFLAWSIIVRDQLQVPLMASGFAILGLVFAATAVMGAANVVRAGREGRDGTAVGMALLGGLLAIAAFLSFAAAIIMALIWGGTRSS